jgi:hypothetical protein
MAAALQTDEPAWAIPPKALAEWVRLSTLVDEIGTVPCRTSDPEAWWPDRKNLDAPATRMAVHGCWRCPAREACLDFALVANEREGVWGGTLPDERKSIR